MLIGIAVLVCLATVPLAGGRLAALADLRIRAAWLPLAAIALQVLIISVLPGGGPAGVHAAAHLATYGMVAAFVVANRRMPFLWLIALGGALNFAAIAANGGVMPADAHALATAGLSDPGENFANSRAVAGAELQFLGDVFAVPASWPFANVFSVGDVVIVAGLLAAVHTVAGSRFALRRLAVPSAAWGLHPRRERGPAFASDDR